MTPSVLLSAPTPLDTDPLNADCTKRPFGVTILTHPPRSAPLPSSTSTTPTSTSAPSSASDGDAYDSEDASKTNRIIIARQWTGAPIRAIIPLPRRKLGLPNGVQDAARMTVPASSGSTAVGPPPCLSCATPRFWDDADSDSEGELEGEDEDGDEEGSIGGCDAPSGSRYCSYESISAAEGLSAWSFEVRQPSSLLFSFRAAHRPAGTPCRVLRPIPHR
ncbi:hypothetical protein OG21DRAFT_129653 [Imleria badia]|nr:hypothetical protein OG21DRAFT_129653 [Imleria badia]